MDYGIGGQDYVDARAEFDEADALAAVHAIALAEVEHDAPRDKAGNLLESDFIPVTLYGDDVLLVLVGGSGVHRVEVLTLLVAHGRELAGDGRTIHVDIEDVEKDADALARALRGGDDGGLGDAAIAGRHNQSG